MMQQRMIIRAGTVIPRTVNATAAAHSSEPDMSGSEEKKEEEMC